MLLLQYEVTAHSNCEDDRCSVCHTLGKTYHCYFHSIMKLWVIYVLVKT